MLFQIFLVDHLTTVPGTISSKDRLAEVHKIVKTISPNFWVTRITFKNKGFLVTFENDEAINLFFSATSTETLNDYNLTAELGKQSQQHRAVFIPDVSEETITKDTATIISQLEAANNIKILKLDKIIAKKNNIKLILYSSKAANDLISIGKIKVFSEIHRAEALGRISPVLYRHPSNQQTPHSTSRWSTSAQNQGNCLSPFSSWGHDKRRPPPNHAHPDTQQGSQRMTSQSTPTHAQSQKTQYIIYHPHPENLVKQYSTIFASMCEFLSKGIEHPEVFISMCNDCHSKYNLPIIHVPPSVIESSKIMFFQKRALSSISSPTQYSNAQTSFQPQSSPDSPTQSNLTQPDISNHLSTPSSTSSSASSIAPNTTLTTTPNTTPTSTMHNSTTYSLRPSTLIDENVSCFLRNHRTAPTKHNYPESASPTSSTSSFYSSPLSSPISSPQPPIVLNQSNDNFTTCYNSNLSLWPANSHQNITD